MTARSLPPVQRIRRGPGDRTAAPAADDGPAARLLTRVTRLELTLAVVVVLICLFGAVAVGATYTGPA